MKIFILLSCVALAAAYTDVPDDASFFEAFLKDEAALKKFFGCILEMNPCDELGSHAKKHFRDSVKDQKPCEGCDALQKHYAHLMDTVIQQDQYKEYYDQYKKLDPAGKYFKQLEETVKDY